MRRRSAGHGWTILSGMCATMTGVGLSRFAYAPLLPAMVRGGWLSGGQAGALGAANLGGYLVGAAIAPAVGRRLGLRPTLRAAMCLATLCFVACAWPGGLGWLLPFRVLTGLTGGMLMVLAGPAVQAVVPAAMRGLAGGLIFAGVGIGIVVGSLLVPLMLPHGLPTAWLALAVLSAMLTAISWRLWPDAAPPPAMRLPRLSGRAGWMVAAYALAAVGQTVHMVWWPDFIARGLGYDTRDAALFWLAYGVAAAIGPALFGRLGDRIGAGRGLQVAMAVQVAAIGLPLVTHAPALMLLSAAGAGAAAIGSTALTLTRARDIGGDQASGLWRIGTASFGLCQTVTGFALAWLYAATGGHAALFAVGLAASLAALLASRR